MISLENAMNQATYTAELYMGAAAREIDAEFGEGYAKKNPALVASFMQVCIKDFELTLKHAEIK